MRPERCIFPEFSPQWAADSGALELIFSNIRLSMITLASLAIHTIRTMSVVELANRAHVRLFPGIPIRQCPHPNGGTSSAFANVQALLVLMTTLCAAGFVGGVVIRHSSPPP